MLVAISLLFASLRWLRFRDYRRSNEAALLSISRVRGGVSIAYESLGPSGRAPQGKRGRLARGIRLLNPFYGVG